MNKGSLFSASTQKINSFVWTQDRVRMQSSVNTALVMVGKSPESEFGDKARYSSVAQVMGAQSWIQNLEGGLQCTGCTTPRKANPSGALGLSRPGTVQWQLRTARRHCGVSTWRTRHIAQLECIGASSSPGEDTEATGTQGSSSAGIRLSDGHGTLSSKGCRCPRW